MAVIRGRICTDHGDRGFGLQEELELDGRIVAFLDQDNKAG